MNLRRFHDLSVTMANANILALVLLATWTCILPVCLGQKNQMCPPAQVILPVGEPGNITSITVPTTSQVRVSYCTINAVRAENFSAEGNVTVFHTNHPNISQSLQISHVTREFDNVSVVCILRTEETPYRCEFTFKLLLEGNETDPTINTGPNNDNTITSSNDNKPTSSKSPTDWIWIVIGCVIVIVLTAIVLCWYRYRKRVTSSANEEQRPFSRPPATLSSPQCQEEEHYEEGDAATEGSELTLQPVSRSTPAIQANRSTPAIQANRDLNNTSSEVTSIADSPYLLQWYVHLWRCFDQRGNWPWTILPLPKN